MSSYVPLAPFYDELTRDVPYTAFADFYEEVFRKYSKKPKTILDLACGTGTLTCILAQRGYKMTGTDSSVEMLSQAASKAYELENADIPMFISQPMEELDLCGTVSAAVCSLDGINYIPPEELPQIFHRLKLSIEPGGIFIFDINTPEKLKNQDGEMYIDETDDVYCVWRAEFSEEENTCTYGMDLFLRQGKMWLRRQEEHIEYAHEISFLTRSLENAGFGDISVFGELRLAEPKEHENRVFIAARRLEN